MNIVLAITGFFSFLPASASYFFFSAAYFVASAFAFDSGVSSSSSENILTSSALKNKFKLFTLGSTFFS